MTNPILTNTPRASDTAEQLAARTAPRGHLDAHDEHADTKASFFYLREPKRGVFVVCIQAWDHVYETVEITREQLAKFLVDGTSMVLRNSEGKEK